MVLVPALQCLRPAKAVLRWMRDGETPTIGYGTSPSNFFLGNLLSKFCLLMPWGPKLFIKQNEMTMACFPGHKDLRPEPRAQARLAPRRPQRRHYYMVGLITSQETDVRKQQQPRECHMRQLQLAESLAGWLHKHSNSDSYVFTWTQESSSQFYYRQHHSAHVSTCCTPQQRVISTITTWILSNARPQSSAVVDQLLMIVHN